MASQHKIDILKCKMLDNGFDNIKDLYVEQQTETINYISSCIKFLEQFQMFQNIVMVRSLKSLLTIWVHVTVEYCIIQSIIMR